MVPGRRALPARRPGAPLARGDGPGTRPCRSRATPCSPRTRGWSPKPGPRSRGDSVLPAHAGMVPGQNGHGFAPRCAPRARGDGPSPPDTPFFSACAPRARGDGPEAHHQHLIDRKCSPRTRGWSRQGPEGLRPVGVLPAHAGMVPSSAPRSRARPSASRARGDGPLRAEGQSEENQCSPRTRGWSPASRGTERRKSVLPAHAGMVPRPAAARCIQLVHAETAACKKSRHR